MTDRTETQGVRFSLLARGSRYQIHVAVFLLAIIPLLSLGFLGITLVWPSGAYSVLSRSLILFFTGIISLIGYSLLRKYPRNIERLRVYLQKMAEGNLPDEVLLPDREDDLSAIEHHPNTILGDLRTQVRQLKEQLDLSRKMQETIENQSESLLEAERQRVMLESLAAACHHIGQLATVLRIGLDTMKRTASDDATHENIARCLTAAQSIGDVLDKLRNVAEYRTIPYWTLPDTEDSNKFRILDIDQPAKEKT